MERRERHSTVLHLANPERKKVNTVCYLFTFGLVRFSVHTSRDFHTSSPFVRPAGNSVFGSPAGNFLEAPDPEVGMFFVRWIHFQMVCHYHSFYCGASKASRSGRAWVSNAISFVNYPRSVVESKSLSWLFWRVMHFFLDAVHFTCLPVSRARQPHRLPTSTGFRRASAFFTFTNPYSGPQRERLLSDRSSVSVCSYAVSACAALGSQRDM